MPKINGMCSMSYTYMSYMRDRDGLDINQPVGARTKHQHTLIRGCALF